MSTPEEKIEAFHKHLGECQHCHDHLFDLCPIGQRLLIKAATRCDESFNKFFGKKPE